MYSDVSIKGLKHRICPFFFNLDFRNFTINFTSDIRDFIYFKQAVQSSRWKYIIFQLNLLQVLLTYTILLYSLHQRIS